MRVILAIGAVMLGAAAPSVAGASTATFVDELLNAMAATQTAGQPPPRMIDSAWSARFREGFDPATLDRSNPAAMAMACQGAVNVVRAYSEYGFPVQGGNLGALKPAEIRALTSNVIAYQDELAFTQRFAISCLGAVTEATANYVASMNPGDWTEARKSGVRRMRDGAAALYANVAVTAVSRGHMRPANLSLVLDAMISQADVVAAAIQPSDRIKVQNAIDAAASSVSPETQAKLEAIRKAMSRKDCSGLCAV